jgi:ATP-dependent DNA helicase RecQ
MDSCIDTLRECLRSNLSPSAPVPQELPDEPTIEYPAQRALLAWQSLGTFAPDVAVLVRQTVRYSEESSLFTGAIAPPLIPELRRVGVTLALDGRLRAEPFNPAWLGESAACDPIPQLRIRDEKFLAEPYLQSVDCRCWRSPAQKEAAWSVLTTSQGATRIVALPTGSGKSLCFQLLPRFDSALTVVVVPTVALAIDQTRGAREKLANCPGVNPIYFSSDDDPEIALRSVKEKETRLLFTSPESCVSGRLRPILDRHARDGWLTNLVVDEAHLIETWGAQFRVEFQVLAALRRQWLAASGGSLRTFLFSATMTADCRRLLLELFSEPGTGSEFVSRRLRPEMTYFHQMFEGDSARDPALFQALLHLPRPLILYVTEVDEAKKYAQQLREAPHGFTRIGCFHGESRRLERRQLLERWQGNELDIMVATSAFGVGVDKRDVRAVVHACYPENLDRYYQEVGRGGRDGWSSICLFLPTKRDRDVARRLSVKLMGEDMIQERWDAMFRDAEAVEGAALSYLLPVDSRRRGLVGQFTYAENVRWNKRLLLQLHRARLADLVDLKLNPPEAAPDANEDPEELAQVRLHFSPSTRALGALITEVRAEERARFDRGLEQLDDLLSAKRCASRALADLYDIDASERVCGGCPVCRARKREPDECPALAFDPAPTGVHHGELVINWPDPRLAAEREDFLHNIHLAVIKKGIRRFLIPASHFDRTLPMLRGAFETNSTERYRIDPYDNATIIATPPEETLAFLHLGSIPQYAFGFARDRSAVHLCTRGTQTVDADGRGIHVHESCFLYHNPEAWFFA